MAKVTSSKERVMFLKHFAQQHKHIISIIKFIWDNALYCHDSGGEIFMLHFCRGELSIIWKIHHKNRP